ncbi:MAG: hypothetical protein AB7E29_12575 [Xanthobacter sp.]
MMNQTASRVIFTGDFLKPAPHRFISADAGRVMWLSRLFGWQVKRATGQAPATIGWGVGSAASHMLSDDDIGGIYDDLALPPAREGWAALQARKQSCAALDALVAHHFSGAFVIGFALPPVLERALVKQGAELLNIRLHPAGFLDDLLFAFRGSSPHLQETLARHAIRHDDLRMMAALAGAAAITRSSFTPAPDSLLLLDSAPDDTPPFEGRSLPRLEDFRADVLRAVEAHKARHPGGRIYYRPMLDRPLPEGVAQDTAAPHHLTLLHAWGIEAEERREPLYALLSHPHIHSTLSLSGDQAQEATFFSKAAQGLLPALCPLAGEDDNGTQTGPGYVGIGEACLGTDFWAEILGCQPLSHAPSPLHKSNRLRLSLNHFGAFNSIDSDASLAAGLRDGRALDGRFPALSMLHEEQKTRLDELGRRLGEVRNEQIAAQGTTHVRLAFLEQELTRMHAALEIATRWQADEMMYRKRSALGRLLFRQDGRPIRALRKTLFHANGKPRSLFRGWVVRSSGEPRGWMRQWMLGPAYLALPGAHHAPSAAHLRVASAGPRPFTAWRSVAGASELSETELDGLMTRIREEVEASRTEALSAGETSSSPASRG